MMQYKVKRRPKSTRKKVRRQNASGQVDKRSGAEGWNNRFHVTTSHNNGELHGFFREYFDK